MNLTMRLIDFDYDLPEDMIAQYPLKKRDSARLMVIDRRKKTIVHDYFYRIAKHLDPQSLLILNDSKVIPARLIGKKENSHRPVEIFLLRQLSDECCFEALLKPLRKIKDHEKIFFRGTRLYATIENRDKMIVRFNQKNVKQYLRRIGHMPLPPYISRLDQPSDQMNYQTVYARHAGSVAAPTAGLHFTKALLNQLKSKGHRFAKVTLHINYGTFQPVQEQDITQHKMHIEEYQMTPGAWNAVEKAREKKQKIIAVGTTSCRVLETVVKTKQLFGNSDLFIYPGFQFHKTDLLITNFHLPKSTLFMLVCAFAGKNFMMQAYQEAIRNKYRFYSYGDCMLIK